MSAQGDGSDARDAAARRRALRLRHLHERQAVVFGALIAALLSVAILGMGVWFGAIPAPFEVAIATPTPTPTLVAQPCPPADARPVPYDQITVNVYNATSRQGLARTTADELAARGLGIGVTANAPDGQFAGTAEVRAGPAGIAHAYTVAQLVPDAVVVLDPREDATVDLVLGWEYELLRNPEEAALDPESPIPAPEGCYDPLAPATTAPAA